MKALLAVLALLAWPAFGQEFTVTTTMVGPLTGPDAQPDMKARDICGTDLGTMAELDGRIVLAFGDTFGWMGDSCPKFGPNMRSNVIGFTTDKDPSDGVVVEDWLTDADGRAIAATEGRHDPPFTGEFTRIPTAMVAVEDTLYLHYMSVHGFSFSPGIAFLCNHSRFIASGDGGKTWDEGESDFGDYLSNFNMLSLSAQPGAGNEGGAFVYAIGTPCGRAFGARVARVPARDLLQKDAWEYWDGAAWTKERAQAVEVIKPGVGEGSLVWNAGIGRWMFASGNASANAIELRFAERPEGPWSEPALLVDVFDYAAPYGSYMTPSWIAEDGLTFYFVMSQFGRYNTYVMKAVLEPRSE
jgi:Domain of unknown function (DUF4185)